MSTRGIERSLFFPLPAGERVAPQAPGEGLGERWGKVRKTLPPPPPAARAPPAPPPRGPGGGAGGAAGAGWGSWRALGKGKEDPHPPAAGRRAPPSPLQGEGVFVWNA